jgi:hypothetical protein
VNDALLILPENECLCALLSGHDNSTAGIRDEEGQHLSWLASQVPAELSIVEIGSHKGKSTCFLAAGSRAGKGAHVYAVDLWTLGVGRTYAHYHAEETWRTFQKQTEPYRDLITPVQMASVDAAKRRRRAIGLLWIDANHTYKGCLSDYQAWNHFVPLDGRIAFHDYSPKYGVKRVIDEVVIPSGRWTDVRTVGRIWSARRR